MHSRMRQRVAQFLKVLNRAKPEPAGEKERKTARWVDNAFSCFFASSGIKSQRVLTCHCLCLSLFFRHCPFPPINSGRSFVRS